MQEFHIKLQARVLAIRVIAVVFKRLFYGG